MEKRSIARPILLLAPLVITLGAFLVLPLFWLLRASFLPGQRLLEGSGFTLAQYTRFFSDAFYTSVLLETFAYGLIIALISLVIGFPVGYSLARLPPLARRWRMIIVIMPLTLSLVVVVFGWLAILGRNGLVNSILLGLGAIETPQRLLFNRAAVIIVLVQQFLPLHDLIGDERRH